VHHRPEMKSDLHSPRWKVPLRLVVRVNGRLLMRLFINISHSLQVLYTVK